MFQVLRDEAGGICRTGRSGSVSTGSLVSVLPAPGNSAPASHWLTATPNPARSVFKPFVFCPEATIGGLTVSPSFGDDDPVKVKPRFQKQVDRRHALYASHQKLKPLPGDESNKQLLSTMAAMETQCVFDVEDFLETYDESKAEELQDLFKDVVESEVKFYK